LSNIGYRLTGHVDHLSELKANAERVVDRVDCGLSIRIARWLVFKPKIPIRVNFGGPLIDKCLYFYGYWEYVMGIWDILWLFGICYGYLVYFVFIWYIFPFFGIKYQEKFGNPAEHGDFRRYNTGETFVFIDFQVCP
jgi:hypothetical protein